MREPEGSFGFNTEVSSGEKQHVGFFHHIATYDVLIRDVPLFTLRLLSGKSSEDFLSSASLKARYSEPQRERNHRCDC